MDVSTLVAALGVLLLAGPALFIAGRRVGANAEVRRQAAAKATAEETARRGRAAMK